MPLTVRCPACGRGHKAPDRAAGRTVACLACGAAMKIPRPEPPAEPAYSLVGLLEDNPAIERPALPDFDPFGPPPADQTPADRMPESAPRAKALPAAIKSLPALSWMDSPIWRRQLHWVLVLALIPLVVSLLTKSPEEASLADRLTETLKEAGLTDKTDDDPAAQPTENGSDHGVATATPVAASPESPTGNPTAEPPVAGAPQADPSAKKLEDITLDDIFAILPGERLRGAFLARSSFAHWFMAAIATLAYMAFFMFLAADGSAKPWQVLLVGLFTSTIGVGFLLLLQFIASATDGYYVIGVSVVTLLFYIVKLIAFSYSAALDPDNGFLLSFIGFTVGVGLCEEMVKAIPLFWFRDSLRGSAWRGLFIWGLASGAGFGIAEGIMYSGSYYNGICGPGVYLVRFLSCVALHAIWTGSVAIFLYERRDSFDGCTVWHEWIVPTLIVLGVPMTLHGLYDTCLKKDLNGVALLVALASFGYLAFLFRRLQVDDDSAAARARRYFAQRRAAGVV